jgi:methionine-rich copper-binding protein CopC
MISNHLRRFLAALLLVSLAGIGRAEAHAHLVTSDPPSGGTVSAAPKALTLTFTEALEPRFSTVSVKDAKGQTVDLADAHLVDKDAKVFAVGLKTLTPGTYTVTWQATAVDTHKTNGSFVFTVAP